MISTQSNPHVTIGFRGGIDWTVTPAGLSWADHRKLAGMTYLTRQEGNPNGKIDKYGIETSTDGKNWSVVNVGEFPLEGQMFDRAPALPEKTGKRLT